VGCTGRADPNPSAERRRPAARADGSFLAHISRETGAAVALRGRGAGGADEGPAPLHLAVAAPSAQAAEAARRLVQSLVDTVRRDHSAAAPAQPQGVGLGLPQARAQLPHTASAVRSRLEGSVRLLDQTVGPAHQVLGVRAPSFILLDSDSRSTGQLARCERRRVALIARHARRVVAPAHRQHGPRAPADVVLRRPSKYSTE